MHQKFHVIGEKCINWVLATRASAPPSALHRSSATSARNLKGSVFMNTLSLLRWSCGDRTKSIYATVCKPNAAAKRKWRMLRSDFISPSLRHDRHLSFPSTSSTRGGINTRTDERIELSADIYFDFFALWSTTFNMILWRIYKRYTFALKDTLVANKLMHIL